MYLYVTLTDPQRSSVVVLNTHTHTHIHVYNIFNLPSAILIYRATNKIKAYLTPYNFNKQTKDYNPDDTCTWVNLSTNINYRIWHISSYKYTCIKAKLSILIQKQVIKCRYLSSCLHLNLTPTTLSRFVLRVNGTWIFCQTKPVQQPRCGWQKIQEPLPSY